jgi:hypothetical protein
MASAEILEEVLTLTEAAEVAYRLGHPLDRSNLVQYANQGRLQARKSGGTWLTTRTAVRELILSLESETRGRPRKYQLSRGRTVRYTRNPELIATLADIQRLRSELRQASLPAQQARQLWDELTAVAIYHTNHLEGNVLTFEEAKAIIDAHRQAAPDAAPDDASQP